MKPGSDVQLASFLGFLTSRPRECEGSSPVNLIVESYDALAWLMKATLEARAR